MFDLKKYTLLKIYIFFFFIPFNSIFSFLIKNQSRSKSQIFQDLFVLYMLKKKKNGTFLEIGAGDGVFLSNTYMLEKEYNWKGILVEPNHQHWRNIKKKRKSKLITNIIDSKCDLKKKFYINSKCNYLSSTLKKNISTDYLVKKTLCLNHLLKKNNIKNIDYCSIDTEGNEFDIIKNFNFKKYNIIFFSIEHNFDTKNRKKIFNVMKKNKYKRIFKFISYMDDWYIKI